MPRKVLQNSMRILKYLIIPLKLAVFLKKYSLNHFPREACGFFFGLTEVNKVRVKFFQPTENSSPIFHTVKVNSLDRETAMQKECYLGFYHSHLYDPKPSRLDIDKMRECLNEIWVIGGLNSSLLTVKQSFELQAFVCHPVSINKLEVCYV